MSLTESIVNALDQAKSDLGDLVRVGILKSLQGMQYDSSSGENQAYYQNSEIQFVNEDFSLRELEGSLVHETDLKISVFNTSGTVNITNKDRISINNTEYEVYKVRRVYVGGTYPMLNVYLKV